jgi:hypothetical protein
MAHPYATAFVEDSIPNANHHDKKWVANQLTRAIKRTGDLCINGGCVVSCDCPRALEKLEASRTC